MNHKQVELNIKEKDWNVLEEMGFKKHHNLCPNL